MIREAPNPICVLNAKRERKLIQVRLPCDLMRQVDHLKIDWGVSRAKAMERLLAEAILKDSQLQMAFESAEHSADRWRNRANVLELRLKEKKP